jgi:hypothetical protein
MTEVDANISTLASYCATRRTVDSMEYDGGKAE